MKRSGRSVAEASRVIEIDEVLVPSEDVTEVRRGQKVNSERKFFPGYVLVKMELTDDAWHLVKDTPKVTGFLGSKTKPSPISDSEAERIMKQTQEGVERPRPAVLFEIGEQVRVADGPFTSFNGTVEDEWDSYVSQLESMGVEDVTATYQQAYDRFQSGGE